MFSKVVLISSVAIITSLFALCSIGIAIRRDLPFQEVVPVDGGIAIINSGKWYQDKISLRLKLHDSNMIEGKYNELGLCLFENLSTDMQYTIEINRNDFKGLLLYKKKVKKVIPNADSVNYIVLIGASIGSRWRFEALPERMGDEDNYIFGSRTIYDFNKSNIIDELISLKADVPIKSVIIKECSAYFPRNYQTSTEQIKVWVDKLKSNGITPVLATVVPVTKAHDFKNPGRFVSILKFNDFIRQYGKHCKIPVLDLEYALRISDEDRHLKEEYAQSDGNHLVQKAYDDCLDKIVMPVVNEMIN